MTSAEHESPYVGRLAPSPTGLLHLGHARSFLLTWLDARSQNGRLRFRLEDLDAHRARAEFEGAALEDLEWLGLDWDGPVTRQSAQLDRYLGALRDLSAQQRTYPCVCSRRDIRAALSAPQLGSPAPGLYPGTCRGRYGSAEEAESVSGEAAGIRFIPEPGPIQFQDRVFGERAFDVAGLVGDFLIARRDKTAAYQLSVVVDDATDGVTQVIRGQDLLESTAQQMHLGRALGYPLPTWGHLPLVLDAHGTRLAKRHDSLSLRALREQGADPRRIVAWALQSVGFSVPGPLRASDALEGFQLSAVSTADTHLLPSVVEALIHPR